MSSSQDMESGGAVVPADVLLVRRALAGQQDAVATLVARLMPVIRARVRRALASGGRQLRAMDGDDLTQEVWLLLIAHGGRQLLAWEPERGMTLEGYVGMVTEREIHNQRGRAAAKKRGGHLLAADPEAVAHLASPQASPEAQVTTVDLAARLGAYLEQELPARGQLVFRHAFTDGRAPTTVATLLGVDVQVVYNWQHKIRRLAREFLER